MLGALIRWYGINGLQDEKAPWNHQKRGRQGAGVGLYLVGYFARM